MNKHTPPLALFVLCVSIILFLVTYNTEKRESRKQLESKDQTIDSLQTLLLITQDSGKSAEYYKIP